MQVVLVGDRALFRGADGQRQLHQEPLETRCPGGMLRSGPLSVDVLSNRLQEPPNS